jgi:hypothetical protein
MFIFIDNSYNHHMNQQHTFAYHVPQDTHQDFSSSALVTKCIKIPSHFKLFIIQINYCKNIILIAWLISFFFGGYLKMLANLFTVKPQSIIHLLMTLPLSVSDPHKKGA